ncbi:MAG: GNAT family N-acetyltransferase [Proteobacteria bacterium]|nr:GNAT family N-acetyltransferase [Pseudomonadota bacterium]
MHIVEITRNKGAACADILAALPHWFGIAESTAAYVRDVEAMPMFGAEENGAVVGFVALKLHTPFAAEIHVLGVVPDFHRRGLGRALVLRAEDFLRERAIRFFTVKTLSPADPDPSYAATRAFYAALGFVPLEEFPTLWSAQNPALMMIKVL